MVPKVLTYRIAQHGELSVSCCQLSVGRCELTGAASRVWHIALTTGDQVHMGVADSLPSSFAAIHADIEAAYRSILFQYIDPYFIQ